MGSRQLVKTRKVHDSKTIVYLRCLQVTGIEKWGMKLLMKYWTNHEFGNGFTYGHKTKDKKGLLIYI